MVKKRPAMPMWLSARAGIAAGLALALPGASAPDGFTAQRERMVDAMRGYSDSIGAPPDARVLAAMRQVPRHLLVPVTHRRHAYRDHPLPIGEDQTISQPSLVALMTHLLEPDPGDVVLEVGTGSGYQAAILSRLVDRVYSIEIVAPLARRAARQLAELGYANVAVRHGDGYAGWPDAGPFDAIIVTAGAPRIPPPLVAQLKPGGRMVIPVGSAHATQRLQLVVKDRKGRVTSHMITAVRFVPLTGEGAERD